MKILLKLVGVFCFCGVVYAADPAILAEVAAQPQGEIWRPETIQEFRASMQSVRIQRCKNGEINWDLVQPFINYLVTNGKTEEQAKKAITALKKINKKIKIIRYDQLNRKIILPEGYSCGTADVSGGALSAIINDITSVNELCIICIFKRFSNIFISMVKSITVGLSVEDVVCLLDRNKMIK